ncbi:MAG: DUF3617 domain-containing protein [Gammaproteobacteria bacterium]
MSASVRCANRISELRRLRRAMLPVMIFLLVAAAWTPSEALQPGMHEISAQTLMPHLEENLRYSRTSERHCIRDDAVSDFFPILRHPSLHGCKLAASDKRGDARYYPLVCGGSSGTTGIAQLREDANRIAGVLAIRMGGKNMTFSQRIEAKRIGNCGSQP